MLTRFVTGLGLGLALLASPARAQTGRDLYDISAALYLNANSPNALARRAKELTESPDSYLVSIDQPGTLVLANQRRVRVPALRYNVALNLLEAQDSTGSHLWPPGSLDGFYLGRGPDARHFRSSYVRDGGRVLTFVEMLTADAAPLRLGVRHTYHHTDLELHPVLRTEVRKALTEINQTVLAGPGNGSAEPLRPLTLNERSVLRLFGTRAPQVAQFAARENLAYTDLAQVLRMVKHYNSLSLN
ncbi:hypothetical protein [Hymenobacter antarcticus]|uniref:Uncharacterized protein n=1 Tax=Hymenobacter antarcticus TaxID=486270 RepID=A0ABP7Q0R3_9BACT